MKSRRTENNTLEAMKYMKGLMLRAYHGATSL